jgi:glyoxylase-like metal-dependent hydrolase (beta-lactamase superfamily II)
MKSLRLKSIAAALCVAAALIAAAAAVPAAAEADKYEVYAVRFATLRAFPAASLIAGAERTRRIDIAMMLWVLKGADGRVALVDTGFHRDRYFAQFTVAEFVSPADAIKPLGIDPGNVTDVFLSHMHWDHAGGLDLFPAARVWIQRDEYVWSTADAWSQRGHGGVDPDDAVDLVRRNVQGKVTLLTGDDDTSISGIGFGVGGKHTVASQFVTVATRAGTVVLASDNMYLYENLERHVPIAQTLDRESNLRTQVRMSALAEAPRLLVPGHDPAIFERFPHIADRIVRID